MRTNATMAKVLCLAMPLMAVTPTLGMPDWLSNIMWVFTYTTIIRIVILCLFPGVVFWCSLWGHARHNPKSIAYYYY